MGNFGFNWMEFGHIEKSEDEYRYIDLFYRHNIPVKFIEKSDFIEMLVPEKYLLISREVLKSYESGKLDSPLNTFESRKFLRKKKLININKGYNKKMHSKFILFFAIILISMLMIFRLLAWLKLIN
jgi:hypothetical protein